MNKNNIQARPIWHPNHLQKHLKNFERYKIELSTKSVKKIICLPSSPFLKKKEIKRISNVLKKNLI